MAQSSPNDHIDLIGIKSGIRTNGAKCTQLQLSFPICTQFIRIDWARTARYEWICGMPLLLECETKCLFAVDLWFPFDFFFFRWRNAWNSCSVWLGNSSHSIEIDKRHFVDCEFLVKTVARLPHATRINIVSTQCASGSHFLERLRESWGSTAPRFTLHFIEFRSN